MYDTLDFFKLCWCRPVEINSDQYLCPVSLDAYYIGKDAIVIKNGQRLCGSGGALCNVPIVQDKAYFEIKIQQMGTWGIGLGTRMANLSKLPLGDDQYSWVFRNDGNIYHNGQMLSKSIEKPNECDILGISYNHLEMSFHKNGKIIDGSSVQGIKGTVYPVFYVDEGAILDVHFTNFIFPPPPGFSKIMVEDSLI